MDNPEVQNFLQANLEFIQKHGQELAEGIQNSQSANPNVKNVGLDEDLKAAFNDVAGSPLEQMLILQFQVIRQLGNITTAVKEYIEEE